MTESTENIEMMTKLARRLPCRQVNMERADGRHGEIYYAYGTDEAGTIHGMWGSNGMVVHGFEFKPDTSQETVRKALVMFADEEIDWFTREGFFHAAG